MRVSCWRVLAVLASFSILLGAAPQAQFAISVVSVPTPLPTGNLVGITYDNVTNQSGELATIQSLGVKPITRIVFDPGNTPSAYSSAIDAFSPYSYIMAEPVDSSEDCATSPTQYANQFSTFIAANLPIDVWEVGNELNGEFLCGSPYTGSGAETGLNNSVVAKAYDAWQQVIAAHHATALTLYYEPPATVTNGYDMVTWAQQNFATLQNMASGLNYVFVSYYETDNNNIRPTQAQWSTIFQSLHATFPNAKLGFGEVGLDCPYGKSGSNCNTAGGGPSLATTESIMSYYYSLVPSGVPWVVGDFYWYAAEDFVPNSSTLATYFRNTVIPSIPTPNP